MLHGLITGAVLIDPEINAGQTVQCISGKRSKQVDTGYTVLQILILTALFVT